jgi:PE family
MLFVTSNPEMLISAAEDLAVIGSAMHTSNQTAAAAITGGVPAPAPEVSALTATQFAAHGALYQTVTAQAAAIHELFVSTPSGPAVLATRRLRQPTPLQSAEQERQR